MCHLNCTALIFLQTTLSRCEKSWHAVNKHILTLFHYVPSIKQATLRMCPYKTDSTFVGKPSKIWLHSCSIPFRCNSHTIHVWYIHLHLPLKTSIHVGKYHFSMDPLGFYTQILVALHVFQPRERPPISSTCETLS